LGIDTSPRSICTGRTRPLGTELFRSADLTTVIEDLAGASQVILYFRVWRIADDGRLHWVQSDHEQWAFDWSAPWSSVTSGRLCSFACSGSCET